jgi:integrase
MSDFITIDVGLYLYKRKRSPYFYVRYRNTEESIDLFRSTKTDVLHKAIAFAGSFKMQCNMKHEHNIPLTTKSTFGKFAKLAKQQMDNDPNPIVSFARYKSIIDSDLVPYFGKTDITSIGQAELMTYFRSLGAMSQTQIRNRQATLKRIFTEAVMHKAVKGIPLMPKVSFKQGVVRDPITSDEQHVIDNKLESFIESARNYKTKAVREAFRFYIRVLASTGIRTGEEMKFSFNDILIDGDKMWVKIKKGKVKDKKKGGRFVLFSHKAQRALRFAVARIHEQPLEDLIDSDKSVFEVNGKFPEFNRTWEQMVEFINLPSLKDKTLYSYRHSYITAALTAKQSITEVAVQCGTSVEMIQKHYSHLLVNSDSMMDIDFKKR